MIDACKAGYSIINYPEGTTSAQPVTLPFKSGGFSAAIENQIPIVPVALWFGNPDAPFVAEDSFLTNFLKCFGALKNDAWVSFGERRTSQDATRLLEDTKEWIDKNLEKVST